MGIVLVEVLLAASIAGFGLAATLKVISDGVRVQSRMEERGRVQRLAEDHFALLRSAPPSGAQRGQFTPPHTEYFWSSQIQQPVDDSPYTLVQLKIWRGQDIERVYGFQTLFAGRN